MDKIKELNFENELDKETNLFLKKVRDIFRQEKESKCIFYALRFKDTKELVSVSCEFTFHVGVVFALDFYQDTNLLWVSRDKKHAEDVANSTVDWTKSTQSRPVNRFVGKLEVIEMEY